MALHEGNQLIAFEPNEDVVACLKRTKELNKLRDMQIVPIAVSNRNGRAPFFLDPLSPATGSIVKAENGQFFSERHYGFTPREIMIETACIDTLCQSSPPPDIMKIDVEGGEKLVFEGGKNFLKQEKPALFFECSRDWRPIKDILSSIGYEFLNAENLLPVRNLKHNNIALHMEKHGLFLSREVRVDLAPIKRTSS